VWDSRTPARHDSPVAAQVLFFKFSEDSGGTDA
jgi:hypothetical protein